MRKRRFYLLLIAALALIGVLVAVLSGPREPEYKGRKLSEWVGDYYSSPLLPVSFWPGTDTGSQEVAKDAISHIGTNALPWLVEWIQYEPQSWKIKLYGLAERISGKHKRWQDYANKGYRRAEQAVEAFRVLGSDAQEAVPTLIQLMNVPCGDLAACRAAISLGYIGRASLPALLTALTNIPAPICNCAAQGIAKMGTNALPSLLRLVRDTNSLAPDAAFTLAFAFGDLKVDPALVVPDLVMSLDNSNRHGSDVPPPPP